MTARALFHVRFGRSREHRQPHWDSATSNLLGAPAQQMLAAVEVHRRHEVTIRQVWQSVTVSTHTNELLGASVIGFKLSVRKWPVVSEAVIAGSFEVEIR